MSMYSGVLRDHPRTILRPHSAAGLRGPTIGMEIVELKYLAFSSAVSVEIWYQLTFLHPEPGGANISFGIYWYL